MGTVAPMATAGRGALLNLTMVMAAAAPIAMGVELVVVELAAEQVCRTVGQVHPVHRDLVGQDLTAAMDLAAAAVLVIMAAAAAAVIPVVAVAVRLITAAGVAATLIQPMTSAAPRRQVPTEEATP